MSRYNDWNTAQGGLIHWLEQIGFVLDVRGIKGKSDRYIGIEIRKVIFAYKKARKLKGSYTDLVLYASNNWPDFRRFIINKDWPQYDYVNSIIKKP